VIIDNLPDYLGDDDLEARGITVEEIRLLDPPPTEYRVDGGRPCWRRDELADLHSGGTE
jgi:hypothetical protein